MSSAEEYRMRAAECTRMAEATLNIDEKAQWLQMGATWLKMANQVETVLPPHVASQTIESRIEPDLPADPDKIN